MFVNLKILFHLKGKVAIITGSGQGLGKAFANGLLSQGAKVR
jgi:NAD(P)-dependent dehydrogenase (short-subunit alcohol dehydrogenase family)